MRKKMGPQSKISRDLRLLKVKLIDIYYYNLGVFAYQTFTNGCPYYFDNYTMMSPASGMGRSEVETCLVAY